MEGLSFAAYLLAIRLACTDETYQYCRYGADIVYETKEECYDHVYKIMWTLHIGYWDDSIIFCGKINDDLRNQIQINEDE